jgi:hypothetical protein
VRGKELAGCYSIVGIKSVSLEISVVINLVANGKEIPVGKNNNTLKAPTEVLLLQNN